MFLSVIYVANDQSSRKELWERIKQLASVVEDDCWLLMGDFNCVLDPNEICGPSIVCVEAIEKFSDCLVQARLLTLLITGLPFTWHNCSLGSRSLWKRLDRVLGNEEWFVK